MKHIVSFSGGAASFVVAHQVIERHGRENVVLVFTDTRIEDEDLYRFLLEAPAKLGVPLLVLADGRTPWDVYEDQRWMGNSRVAHCSVELKAKVFHRWLVKDHTPENCVVYFGFDWSEEHRHKDAVKNWAPFKVESPLCAPPYLSRSQIFQVLDDYDIAQPRLYEMGFTHNNCGGFCCRAGQGHFQLLLKTMPERYREHEDRQERLFAAVPTARPSIRMVRDKKTHYLSLKEFREHLEKGGACDSTDVGGCGCFGDVTKPINFYDFG